MKKVVSSSLLTLLILVLAAAGFFYIRGLGEVKGDPVACIPADAFFYVSVIDGEAFISTLQKPDAWGAWQSSTTLKKFRDKLSLIEALIKDNDVAEDIFNNGSFFVSSHVTGAGTFDFLLLKAMKGSWSDSKSMMEELTASDRINTREYDGIQIGEVTLKDDNVLTWAFSKGVLICSFTSFLVEDALRQQKVGRSAVYKVNSEETGSAKGVFSFSGLPLFLSQFTRTGYDGFSPLKDFASWMPAMIESSEAGFTLTGQLVSSDTLHLINNFQNQQPVKADLLQLLPSSTAAMVWYGASDMPAYRKRLALLLQRKGLNPKLQQLSKRFDADIAGMLTKWVDQQYAFVITEPSSTQYENNAYAVFKTRDVEATVKTLKKLCIKVDGVLKEKTREESYHGYTIRYLRLEGVFQELYGPGFSKVKRMFYTVADNMVVFGNQAAAIRNFIDELADDNKFAAVTKGIVPVQGASIICVVRPSMALPVYNAVANTEYKKLVNKNPGLVSGTGNFSFIATQTGNGMRASVRIEQSATQRSGPRLLFNVDCDSSVSLQPLVFAKGNPAASLLLFQDDSRKLYLTDDAGNKIWEKTIGEPIMSKIYLVDYFRNGNVQFLFNTASHIYLFDDKGESVGSYPIRLPAAATNAMTIASPGPRMEEVIYVACDNQNLYAYNLSGRTLSGWNFHRTPGKIIRPVDCFYFNGKLELLIADDAGNNYITGYTGTKQLEIKEQFVIAKNAIITFDTTATSPGLFVTSTTTGGIVKVSKDGAVEQIPLNFASPDHGFISTDVNNDGTADYLFVSGKELVAYDPSLALIYRKEFENSLGAGFNQVFIGNELRLLIHSAAANKTWMIKTDGSIISGFPVRGGGDNATGLLGAEGRQVLIIGSSVNGINVYALQ